MVAEESECQLEGRPLVPPPPSGDPAKPGSASVLATGVSALWVVLPRATFTHWPGTVGGWARQATVTLCVWWWLGDAVPPASTPSPTTPESWPLGLNLPLCEMGVRTRCSGRGEHCRV